MANNKEADGSRGSGGGDMFKTYLQKEEVTVLAEHLILVPAGMRLPHGSNISLDSLAIPPLPTDKRECRTAIRARRQRLTPEQ